MNIISRRRYDGLEVGGHYGFGDSYNQWDVSVTGGVSWDKISAWASYSYAHNDIVRFGDRPYARNWDYINNLPADTSCSPGNVTQAISATATLVFPIVNGVVSAAPGLGNRCDNFLNHAMFPESSRHSAMAGISAELTDNITFDVRAFYAHRRSTTDNGVQTYSINAGPGRSIVGNFANVFGTHTYASSILETWGITPQVTVKLGDDWRVVAFYNYGRGQSRFESNGGIDSTALNAANANGAFNPLTGTFASTPAGAAALAAQQNRFGLSQGIHSISNGRVTVDGPLATLPGGDLRVAFGGEILHEDYAVGSANGAIGVATFAERKNDRTITSAFGEVSLPLFGEGNATAGFHSLVVSASGRYDHYSDVGGTFNPKFGATWEPVPGWTIRGNWSTSYQAPSLAERTDVAPATFNSFPANFLGYPSSLTALFLYPGSTPGLRPQKATTWEVGTDIRPEGIPGLSISATYYSIHFSDRIGNPPFFNGSVFLAQFPNNYTLGPLTSQQVQDFVNQAQIGTQNAQTFINNPSTVYALIDARSINLSTIDTTGVDFNVTYSRPTEFGRVFGQVSGSYVLTYDVQAFAGGPTTNLSQNGVSQLRLQAMAGATVGKLTGRATVQHTGGYDVAPVAAALNQSRVGSLTVLNLAFNYDFEADRILNGTSLTFNVDNVFDSDPPLYNGIVNTSQPGFAGFTLGRVFQFGIRKKF
jgi:iron complex outermembrane receptor protein